MLDFDSGCLDLLGSAATNLLLALVNALQEGITK